MLTLLLLAFSPAIIAFDANALLCLVNQERARAYVAPLKLCTKLNTAAQRHSEDMAQGNFMSHTGSNGSNVGQRIDATGLSYRGWGENVAKGQQSLEEVMKSWMNSSGHKANILGSQFTHFGGGMASNCWTQDFATTSEPGTDAVCDVSNRSQYEETPPPAETPKYAETPKTAAMPRNAAPLKRVEAPRVVDTPKAPVVVPKQNDAFPNTLTSQPAKKPCPIKPAGYATTPQAPKSAQMQPKAAESPKKVEAPKQPVSRYMTTSPTKPSTDFTRQRFSRTERVARPSSPSRYVSFRPS
jgi:hypothetical protein